MSNPVLVKAKNTQACCSDCGRMAAIFRQPLPLEQGLAVAVSRARGREDETILRARIADMRASRLLLEV